MQTSVCIFFFSLSSVKCKMLFTNNVVFCKKDGVREMRKCCKDAK